MDSKVVDQTLRQGFWPDLKASGFNRRTGRTSWRQAGPAIQCISVQSFNTYNAERIGATTFSFGINIGVFYPEVARRLGTGAFVQDHERPKEYECQLRKFMTKGVSQPNDPQRRLLGLLPGPPALGPWKDRPDVWLVLSDGSNLEAMVVDAHARVFAEGLPWLERLSEPREAIRRLFEEPDLFVDGVMAELYGGAIGSPSRWATIGALATVTKDRPLLERAVAAMQAEPYFHDRPGDLATLRAELARLA